eukprot:2302322-Pleurochrysis_carterae.AAC.2
MSSRPSGGRPCERAASARGAWACPDVSMQNDLTYKNKKRKEKKRDSEMRRTDACNHNTII